MSTLIVKLGATGDVVRTTPLLRRLSGRVTWITSSANRELLDGLEWDGGKLQVLRWEDRGELSARSFDLVINLEDDPEVARVLLDVPAKRRFGAYLNDTGAVSYTIDSRKWFDMSLISAYGRERADRLKLRNRLSYQEHLFTGLGLAFRGEPYLLPWTSASDLQGDVALAAESGPVWPMKRWDHYARLKVELEQRGLNVNYLPWRPNLLEHLADVRGHRCVVTGDSLPMHLALGSGVPVVALFNCTSPWEIYDYGILTKLVSPNLAEFFYDRRLDPRATRAIPLSDVLAAVMKAVDQSLKV